MGRLISIFLFFIFSEGYASPIILHAKDAIVWHPEQKITGELSGINAQEVIVHHDQISFSVNTTRGQHFSFKVTLHDLENKIWVEVPGDSVVVSDTLHYKLGYNPVPIMKPFATVNNNTAILQSTIIENPYKATLNYLWMPDSLNPASSQILQKEDSVTSVQIPPVPGIYRFNLLVVAEEDSTWYQTFVERDEQGLNAFEIDSAYPQWMDSAIIYQITPYSFVKNGTFDAITTKLHELKSLGINTIWLQPIFKTFDGGQGYDVTDYFSLNPAFGTEEQLKHLISTAKDLGLKVLFDVVLNHSSIHHPYAKDRKKYGGKSHYYTFYQHEDDGKPYSSFYTMDEYGFINYFWDDLVNLNYQNEEVQRWMLEVCKFWVREYDIDGYRLDAIWGVNARAPFFAKRLRTELKSIKPEVLLLAEDKGSVPEVFELGYDAAYDWMADTSWVSQWSWEYEYEIRKSHTIFNFPKADERGEMLRQALFENGGNVHRQLRYIENNDLPRFVLDHGTARTKMAAALLFSLPGIPMLYNGQEIGFRGHPYSTRAVFHPDSSIQSMDKEGFFDIYKDLIRKHQKYPALWGSSIQELPVSPKGTMVAFRRWKGNENFIVIVNLGKEDDEAHINFRGYVPGEWKARKYRLEDVLSGATFKQKKQKSPVKIPISGYSVRWLLVKK